MARTRVAGYVCAVVVAVLLSCTVSHAQMGNTGFVDGIITDPSGAAIAGASVTLRDRATGAERNDTTKESGRFSFASVVPGRYDITISKAGFRQLKFADQEVVVGESRTFDAKLEIGAPTETVEVVAANTELQTLNATIGNTVTSKSLDALPSLNRDVSTFVELQPGVSPDGSVAGAVVDQSTFMLDGGNNSNDMDGSMSVYTPTYAGDPTGGISNQSFGVAAGPTGVMPTPTDSVEEFKVNSAQQTADFNSSAGAQIQIVTRRGTDQFHGSGYWYYVDNTMSANNWQNNASGVPVPDWHRNRFGGRAGGKISPKPFLGGNWYLFGNYEGYRWPESTTITSRAVPSDAMRLGLLTFGGVTYNLNPYPVTFNGNTYGANAGCNGPCDPRGIGINTLVQQMWNQHMPQPNNNSCSRCDGVNVEGFQSNVGIPQTSDFGVVRLDHDIGQKWHVMASYRYFKLKSAGTEQVDIGGLLGSDKVGIPASLSNNPQLPWYYVVGVTTNITSNVTNDFHYNFLRNWWAWGRAGDIPQQSGLGGALEPFGETASQVLSPYNVNTQQTRTRFWDGHDNMIRDDVSWLKGSHLLQFGGTYQHNWNYHQRTDNGNGTNYQPVYELGITSGAGINMGGYLPSALATSDAKNFGRDYAAALGIVSISQQAYTRSGSNLALNPPLTPAFDKSTIPFYNVYFSDSWRIKPSLTLNYGLGWTLEMPPTEQNGKQILLVDQNNKPISVENYLQQRENAALNGQPYNPTVGFNLVRNTGRKYPYNPYYHSFSPRVSVAWSPQFSGNWLGDIFGQGQSVIRGGYNRIYGRLNGVDLVLVPLLGTGLIQPVQCFGALNPAAAAALGSPCAGASGANPLNAFRVGTDGLTAPLPAAAPTLPQPLFPGINGIAAGAGEALDPNFRPNVIDSWNLTIQRQFKRSFLVEVGYIGRHITHEYQPLNINAVPYMMTLGGQRFDKAYANVVLQYCGGVQAMGGGNCLANAAAVQPQPFFEAALKGTGYCNGFSSCTAAVVANEGASKGATGNLTNASVWSLWSDLDQGGSAPGFNFSRDMLNSPLNCPTGSEIGCSGQLTSGVGINASVGYGNYNAGFVTFKLNDWHGMTAQSNFTYGKALSTQSVVQATSADTADDPYNLRRGYGLAPFDRKYVFNTFVVYTPSIYKSQQGLVGHLLGGWTFGPIFTAGSGQPVTLGTINGGGQAFGEGDSVNFFGNGNSENAIPIGPLGNASGAHYHPTGGSTGCGTKGIATAGFGPNLFANPVQAFCNIRQPILGLDNGDGGWGVIRGLGYWNMDLSAMKQIRLTERFNLQATFIFINVFNHVNFEDPGPGDYIDTSSPGTFGTLPQVPTTAPRTIEFGLRLNF
jgi:hypothetical protein